MAARWWADDVQEDHLLGDELTQSSEARPWGAWHVLDEGDGYKVKRIEVKPHKRLSYQTHAHRAEIWVIVQGVATCLIDGRTTVAQTGEIVEVGIGAAHRITNDHDEDLVIVEVQRGSYTGEDDIVRLEDDFGRVPQATDRHPPQA